MAEIEYRADTFPSNEEMFTLRRGAWSERHQTDWAPILSRGLGHVTAHADGHLIGFVNIAWDGGAHAFLLDTTVHPDFQHRGIGTQLVKRAADLARERGGQWLHVDFEPHLLAFYRACGFEYTEAGLMELK